MKRVTLFMVMCFVFGLQQGWANTPIPVSESKARANITTILAAKGPAKIDRKLKSMERDLKRAFGKRYQRFSFLSVNNLDIAQDKERKVSLPDGAELKLTFKGRDGGYLRIHLAMPGWDGLVRVKNGKRFFQAGLPFKGVMFIVYFFFCDFNSLNIVKEIIAVVDKGRVFI